MNSLSFENAVVWITGASSGIGEQIAYALSKRGAQLILSGRDEEKLKNVKEKTAHPKSTVVFPLDLEKLVDAQKIIEKALTNFGRIDVLICNAGISQRAFAAETTAQVDRKIMEVNYFGHVLLTKALLPHMRKQKKGHLVVISSLAGKFGFPLRSAYAASKHALQGFYESLRLEEKKHGINVTIAFPGRIRTAIDQHALLHDGTQNSTKDILQAKGMPAETCAKKLLNAVEKNRREVLIGKGELALVWLRRISKRCFFYALEKIAKQYEERQLRG